MKLKVLFHHNKSKVVLSIQDPVGCLCLSPATKMINNLDSHVCAFNVLLLILWSVFHSSAFIIKKNKHNFKFKFIKKSNYNGMYVCMYVR